MALGILHKEVQLEPFAQPVRYPDGRVLEGLRTVYYTLKGEEWRIPAWKLVSEASRKSGWNDSFERLEGMLLGYDEWQNDWWAERRRRHHQPFGKLLLHLAVTAKSLPPSRMPVIAHSRRGSVRFVSSVQRRPKSTTASVSG